MAASNEWFEYHLTPRGWEMGSNRTDSSREEKRPPADRVLTIRISEHMSSSFSRIVRDAEELWASGDADAIADLQARFGAMPT